MLLVLVLGVWGTIAYKIISGLNPELPELNTTQVVASTNFKLDTTIDTFSIQTVGRDPFLGTVTKPKTTPNAIKKRKAVTWLPIEYLGIVKNKNHKEQVFIVSINARQSLLKRGQTKDSITLVKGNASTLTLRYKGEHKIIKRKAH